MELNREQIIKALECCRYGGRCVECPCFEIPNCQALANENALALIKELTEENKKLIDDNKWCSTRILEADRIIIETRKNADELSKTIPMMIKEIQADTVREMQERLTKEFDRMHKSNFLTVEVRQWIIDQIAKEVLEGEG